MIPRELMDELRYLEIYTRKAVRDHHVGDYRSPLRGRGFEFDQHKRYQHGDDYRQIDWNATARMGHPFVKRDFEEKELSAVIIADLSRSMDFASGDASKREQLVRIAATLVFSAASDNMRVGLLGFTDFALPFEHLLTRLTTSTLLFMISDFAQAESSFHCHALRHLARKHDLMPLIIEDPWDLALPGAKGFMRLHDAESGSALVVNLSRHNKNIYQSLMKARRAALQNSFYHLNLDHLFVDIGSPYLDSLLGFFLTRKRRR